MTNIPDTAYDPKREIHHGVEQPGVYDGVLYWIDTNGWAYHRFIIEPYMSRAQPYIDAYNRGRAWADETDKSHKTGETDK